MSMPGFAASRREETAFARDVREHLSRTPQRELPPEYFYDAVGSRLFEAITELPEYGLTRADERLLRNHAAEITRAAGPPGVLAELGSGTGRKTRWILAAMRRIPYYPIDLSPTALQACREELGSIARVETLCASYLEGLEEAAARRNGNGPLMVLFLGSTIGNFEREAGGDFLRQVRRQLRPGDSLLLGTDMLKPVELLLSAYDDPAGVTAAFNLNLLARVNRELGGNFDLRRFHHEARWCEQERRIEMHAVSLSRQTVCVPAAGLRFEIEKGESIWTESSHKYSPEDLDGLAGSGGFEVRDRWVDPEWPFSETLMMVPS
jgi:L-histidine N-alpha-methyltransferase